MNAKNELKQAIAEVVIAHENKLHNCDELLEIMKNSVISAMENQFPNIMGIIKKSDKKIKVTIDRSDAWESTKSRNVFTGELFVPREKCYYRLEEKDTYNYYDLKLSLYDVLSLEIKSMLVPILIQEYSILSDVPQMEYAEYCVQRIDDFNFYSKLSNLVYAKHCFNFDRLLNNNVKIGVSTAEIRDLLADFYEYATDEKLDKNELLSVRRRIEMSLKLIVEECTEHLKNSAKETSLTIYNIILNKFNEVRKQAGLYPYSLEYDDMVHYSTLIKELTKEKVCFEQSKGYCDSNFNLPWEDGISRNGFFDENGEFIRIETREDSLIETVKKGISYKKLFNGKGILQGDNSNAFYYYGWNNEPLCLRNPMTVSIVYETKTFINGAKVKLADMVIEEYALTDGIVSDLDKPKKIEQKNI